MTDFMGDLKEFHRAAEEWAPDAATIRCHASAAQRYELMAEELDEYWDAVSGRDLEGVADAVVDILYTAFGTAVHHGLPIEELWAEVHRSNMAKFKYGLMKDENGKVMKPHDWKAPDIRKVLDARQLELKF